MSLLVPVLSHVPYNLNHHATASHGPPTQAISLFACPRLKPSRLAQFSILHAKRPTPLNLTTPNSYCYKSHPHLTPLVSPMRPWNGFYLAPISSPVGSIFSF